MGVDVLKGGVKDMKKQGVIEPVRVKEQAIRSAAEAASMILRIDDVIASQSRPRHRLLEAERCQNTRTPLPSFFSFLFGFTHA